ncbi:hypothetical protein GCM10011611_02650 [Aliidongia dinghuensis]|uniref:NYN domain-containing protein n=1 Tax=Aliidongia dinghuensis TaxID=1867774 RepID=A0A8J2YP29_9PROT|nr:NYN domain-containing protein [Aliidongia dinghuensis]GGF00517.1 hypothetical protein GCM10011611_02650 [Aliidongia dinghuensis]
MSNIELTEIHLNFDFCVIVDGYHLRLGFKRAHRRWPSIHELNDLIGSIGVLYGNKIGIESGAFPIFYQDAWLSEAEQKRIQDSGYKISFLDSFVEARDELLNGANIDDLDGFSFHDLALLKFDSTVIARQKSIVDVSIVSTIVEQFFDGCRRFLLITNDSDFSAIIQTLQAQGAEFGICDGGSGAGSSKKLQSIANVAFRWEYAISPASGAVTG